MALNKTILKKLESKTSEDINIRNFIVDILQFESKNKGWYEKEYNNILENYYKEVE